MALSPITKTCTPRPDVLSGRLSDEHFAADLDHIVRDPASYPVYGDPDEFFALTHPTAGLQKLLTRTFGRISGAKDIPGAERGVLRPQTVFGGGKTHGLIALYHLASGARPAGIDRFVDPSLLPDDCVVAAAVGDKFSPTAGIDTTIGGTTDTARTYTLWGDLAAQLGPAAWAAMKPLDEAREAPGTEVWAEVFGDRPTVVIIDEIAQHVRQCATSGNLDVRRQADAIAPFLKALLQHAAATPNLMVVISLATHADAYGGETTDLEAILNEHLESAEEAAADTKSVLARHQTIIRPAEDTEIAEILKTRLFADIDPKAAAAAGAAYETLYENLGDAGLPDGADQPAAYAKRVIDSYPFHPELIRVLDKRIGTIPEFQRARGALRLLAEVVAAEWETHGDAPTLNVGDVDLDAGNVLINLTAGLGRDAYEPAARVDITDPDSHARSVDTERFTGKAPYASRAATCVFMHSLEQSTAAGAARGEYLLGTLRPGDAPEAISEALDVLSQRAWHLAFDGVRYVVRTEANANAVIAQEALNLPPAVVSDEVTDRIERAFKPEPGAVTVLFPTSPALVADKPELHVVVMDPDDTSVTAKTAEPPPARIQEIRDRKGAGSDFRAYRNAVCFLVADTDQVEHLRDRVKWHLAARRILDSDDRRNQLGPEVVKRIETREGDLALDARVALSRCFCHLYYPTKDKANADLRHFELPPADKGSVPERQTRVVIDALESENKKRTTKIGWDYLKQKAWPKAADEVTVEDVADAFWRDHSAALVEFTFIQDAVRAGVAAGEWVYWDADAEKAATKDDPAPAVERKASAILYTPAAAEAKGILKAELTADVVLATVTAKKQLGGTELRAQLEKTLGWEPTKGAVADVLTRVATGPNSQIIVVDGDPKGTTPAPKSTIEKASLDKLTVLTRAAAVKAGVDLDAGTAAKVVTVTGKGLAGPAFTQADNKAAEVNGATGLNNITVKAAADPGEGIKDLRALGLVLGQIPKPTVTVDLELELDLGHGEADIRFDGPRPDYQDIEDTLLSFATAAGEALGALTVRFAWPDPVPLAGPEWEALRKAIHKADPGEITVTAEVHR